MTKMIDRAQVEAVITRVAVAAFTYYPERPTAEPGYTLGEDVAWCIRPLISLEGPQREAWRLRIADLIANPTADRQAFIRDLAAIAGE
tara:strand:- start:4403 stop:4666 length:264 start_codon:yes stop_codon:yes gene_type:complete